MVPYLCVESVGRALAKSIFSTLSPTVGEYGTENNHKEITYQV
jgi:hypothetical protein